MNQNGLQSLVTEECIKYGVPVPHAYLTKDLPIGAIGSFLFKNYTIKIHSSIVLDTQVKSTVLHECRHAWQYHYYRLVYLFGLGRDTELQRQIRKNVLEVDAKQYETSLGHSGREDLLIAIYPEILEYLKLNSQYSQAAIGHPEFL